jgi:hypothetical protein
MNKDQEASVLKDMQVYIILAVGGSIFLCFAFIAILVVKKYAEKIKTKLKGILEKTMFNGALRSIYISYLQVALSTAISLKLVMKGSKYADSSSIYVSLGTATYLYGIIVWMIYILFKNKG